MDIKFEGLSDVVLKVEFITVLFGKGKFIDNNDGETYDIYFISVPMLGNGKHISVHSKDMEDVTEWRSYDDGKILSFECTSVEHWEC